MHDSIVSEQAMSEMDEATVPTPASQSMLPDVNLSA